MLNDIITVWRSVTTDPLPSLRLLRRPTELLHCAGASSEEALLSIVNIATNHSLVCIRGHFTPVLTSVPLEGFPLLRVPTLPSLSCLPSLVSGSRLGFGSGSGSGECGSGSGSGSGEISLTDREGEDRDYELPPAQELSFDSVRRESSGEKSVHVSADSGSGSGVRAERSRVHSDTVSLSEDDPDLTEARKNVLDCLHFLLMVPTPGDIHSLDKHNLSAVAFAQLCGWDARVRALQMLGAEAPEQSDHPDHGDHGDYQDERRRQGFITDEL